MKKIRKIIAFTLMMVMMMAMSVTAFAEEASSVIVKGLAKGAIVNIYTVATVSDDNEVVTESWTNGKYPIGQSTTDDIEKIQMTAEQVNALKSVWSSSVPTATAPQTAGEDGVVTFSNLPAGVYYIVATSDNATYSPMVSVALAKDGNGNYVVATDEVTAKGTDSDLDKTAKDTFVYAGEEVEFTITKSVPSYVDKFVIYDKTTNLSSLDGIEATVTIKDTDYNKVYKFKAVDNEQNKFALDLTDIVYDSTTDSFINTYETKTVVITYKATVVGADGYTNEVTYAVNDSEETGTHTVTGVEGDITLTKYNEDGTEVLNNAEFNVYKDGSDTPLSFIFVEEDADGVQVYKLAEVGENGNAKIVAKNGTVKVTGLDEGKYHFEETKAPANYSINPAGADAELKQGESVEAHINTAEASLNDTKLSTLPFTGGMGTTIFTVLGVAIMVLAAALYFVSKRKAAK